MKYLRNIFLFIGLSTYQIQSSDHNISKNDRLALELIGGMKESLNISELNNSQQTAITPQASFIENKAKLLFNQLCDQYLTQFGQVYEKKGGLLHGYRKIYYIAAKDNQNQPITAEFYPLFYEILQRACQHLDWGSTINLELSVIKNGIFIKENLNINEICRAVEQVPLPKNYSLSSIIASAAAITAIAAGAYLVYNSFGHTNSAQIIPQSSLPIHTNDVTPAHILPAQASADAQLTTIVPPFVTDNTVNSENTSLDSSSVTDNTFNSANKSLDSLNKPEHINPAHKEHINSAQEEEEKSWITPQNTAIITGGLTAAALAHPATRRAARQQMHKMTGAHAASQGVQEGLKKFADSMPAHMIKTTENIGKGTSNYPVVYNHRPRSLQITPKNNENVPTPATRESNLTKNPSDLATQTAHPTINTHAPMIQQAEQWGAPGAYGSEFSVGGHFPLS